MKKYLLSLPIILFPYTVLAGIFCLYTGVLMEKVFQNNGFLVLAGLVLFAIIAAGFTAVICGFALYKRAGGQGMARLNMMIKLCQIPAYLTIFALGVFCVLSIWGILLALLLVLVDCVTIAMSGLIGATSAFRNFREQKMSRSSAVKVAVCQFIFCVDVFASIKLYLDSQKMPQKCFMA